MNEPCHIQLFGSLRVQQGERLISRFRTQQTGALLAYLAYHRHQSHSREALLELFWPESEPETGRHNLSNALSSLRAQLEPPGVPGGSVIIADRFSVELNSDAVTTDVVAFEQALRRAAQARTAPNHVQMLIEAAEKYGGRLLPHYYEDWIAPEQARLQQRFQQTVSQLVGLLERAGEFASALDWARRSLSTDPLREEAHRDVMRLLASVGQPTEALHQFRELERLLSQELGSTPSAATRQVALHIEAQGITASTSLPTPPPAPAPARPEVSTPLRRTGTLTVLLTDIEGATALWEKTSEAFRAALASHHTLLRAEFRRNGGWEVKEAGDSFLAGFAGVGDALHCAIACQKALSAQPWPEAIGSLKVRMALHTGDVRLEDGEYHGLMLHRAARMLSAGHGGQILVSEATAGLLRRDLEPGVSLKDLGLWRLRDVEEPERLFQVETARLEAREFPPLNAEPAQTTRLPLQFDRFFGRTEEIAAIGERLQSSQTRLLTLTGPGGTGKTRLAVEALSQFGATFQGGIWFVPLANISDSGLIGNEIVGALGIPRSGQIEPLEQAVAALAKQPSLLILDNFEQLVEGGAEIVQALLTRLPALQCVVTSRQLLGLSGEQEFAVPPLSTPHGADTPERLSMFDSVRLFVDRAQASAQDFQLTSHNGPAVAELCDRLEGLPLAIELAAARTQVMTPAQMLAQLSRRFEFLVSRRRGVAERQRTLRAAVDWSYKLLSPELQRFFAQLSVFRGGWTVEAAEAVCEESLTLDYLAQLRECSLVLTDVAAQGIRFRMLETLREYGNEQLAEEERATIQRHHLAFFLALAEEIRPKLQGPEQAHWMDVLEEEHDNLRTALVFCQGEMEEVARGLCLGVALQRFWEVRGYLSEGRRQLTTLLSHAGALGLNEARGNALDSVGVFARLQGDHAAARSCSEESLDISREVGDRNGIASSLHNLGRLAFDQGEYAKAQALYEESLGIRRELEDRRGIASSLHMLGIIASYQGDDALARSLCEESLRIRRELGDVRGIAQSLHLLGAMALEKSEYTSARSLFEDCLLITQNIKDRYGVNLCINSIGIIAYEQSDYINAKYMFEEALVISRELGIPSEVANNIGNLANVANAQGDYALARSLQEESLGIRRELGDRRGVAHSLDILGIIASNQGDYALARSLQEESLGIRRELGDRRGVALSLHMLGVIASNQDDYALARSLCEESLGILRELGDRWNVAHSLEAIAALALKEKNAERGVRLWGAVSALREQIGALSPMHAIEREKWERDLAAAQEALGGEAFTEAQTAGRTMTWEQAVAFALEERDGVSDSM